VIAGSGAVAAVAFNAVEIRRGIIIDRKRGGFGRRSASGVRYLGGDDHSAGGVEIVCGETGRRRTAYVWGRGNGVAFDRRAIRPSSAVDGQLGLAFPVNVNAPAADDRIV